MSNYAVVSYNTITGGNLNMLIGGTVIGTGTGTDPLNSMTISQPTSYSFGDEGYEKVSFTAKKITFNGTDFEELIAELRKEIEDLKMEIIKIKNAPGGIDYLESEAHFEELIIKSSD
jgi:hypothetical protein